MHTRAAGLGALLLMLLAGCGGDTAAITTPQRPVVTDWPAATAGGACALLDYAVIEEVIGVRFDLAAASRQGSTSTCVMRAGEAAQPDLTFWVTAATEVAIFKAEIVPKGSQSVKNLGAAAYQTTRDGAGKQGPEAEVSWVTKEKQLVALRFTFAGGQPRSEATALAPKLVELAAKVDPSRL